MTPTDQKIEDLQVRGIFQMKATVEQLQRRIREWEMGIMHVPRTEIERLTEVVETVGNMNGLYMAEGKKERGIKK